MMSRVPEIFGSMVFNETVMRDRLPKDTYKALKETIQKGKTLDVSVANVVAHAMKDWAIEKGATHYTHWFQPMTGVTAEKHDSFISAVDDGNVIMSFSGKELVRGEPDASSFPSGGLRATFEARGYTAWDPTSYAFIKQNVLCIPTVFCSYTGDVLDKKTPLLRSMEELSKQALRLLKLFGVEANQVITTVGAEQEYFLVDKADYEKRKDLIYTGRTLFGCMPPKGQELENHYFGTLKERVAAYMDELDDELWKLGVLAKTKHNEVAPAQHELAPIFTNSNLATDQNQLMMELMQRIAKRHGMVCLLHEKPFDGINGSGKHNNWSVSTDTGLNLFEPGKTPDKNSRFLLFVAAAIKAVDEHQDLLRLSTATAGNDHRLGANEAPPAIVSMFLGEELTDIFEAIEKEEEYHPHKSALMGTGVDVLPDIPKDNTDRNRTSPFAFTGNKFEFRMVGSNQSIAGINIVLNTVYADVLMQFADRLEKADDFNAELHCLIRETYHNHKRIVFNGDGYSDDWVDEAKRRGLLNLRTSADALPYFAHKKNVDLFVRHGVFSESEVVSRTDIMLEEYCKLVHIEALTMLDMAKKDILPAVASYVDDLTETALHKKALCETLNCEVETDLVKKLSDLMAETYKNVAVLADAVDAVDKTNPTTEAASYSNNVLPAMDALRASVDAMEDISSAEKWPLPSYGDLLFDV